MTREILGTMMTRLRRAHFAGAALVLSVALSGCLDGGVGPDEAHTLSGESGEHDPDAPSEPRVEKGGAVATCFSWRASGHGPNGGPNSVTADCLNVAGQLVTSEVWLPACVGNSWGNLVHGGNYFDRSCRNCGLHTEFRPERYRFFCECNRGDGYFQPTNLPISDYLTNRNGQLTCD